MSFSCRLTREKELRNLILPYSFFRLLNVMGIQFCQGYKLFHFLSSLLSWWICENEHKGNVWMVFETWIKHLILIIDFSDFHLDGDYWAGSFSSIPPVTSNNIPRWKVSITESPNLVVVVHLTVSLSRIVRRSAMPSPVMEFWLCASDFNPFNVLIAQVCCICWRIHQPITEQYSHQSIAQPITNERCEVIPRTSPSSGADTGSGAGNMPQIQTFG